jgi:hypothetical protein
LIQITKELVDEKVDGGRQKGKKKKTMLPNSITNFFMA